MLWGLRWRSGRRFPHDSGHSVGALALTALEREARCKAALLSGPQGAWQWLEHGGVILLEDGSIRVIDPA